jgi:hypothetical protein
MDKLFSRFGLIAGVVFTFLIFVSSVDSTESTKSGVAFNQLPQQIYPAMENKTYTFAGEAMPDNFDNRERLNRELSVNAYWQSNTMLNIKKANRYFPLMERILAEEGVPDDFKYLAVAESDLRNATSHANAKGFWQFRKPAAKEMGLEVNDEVDERYHVERATRAAAKYLTRLRNRFGTWTNAAAAYNVGQGNFNSSRKTQDEFSAFDMNMNIETSRYIFRLMAIKEIMSNPEQFGFYVDHADKYPPLDNFYEVTVTSSVPSWASFAKEKGISYRMLKVYNPWLVDNKLTVKKNTYHIKIPR